MNTDERGRASQVARLSWGMLYYAVLLFGKAQRGCLLSLVFDRTKVPAQMLRCALYRRVNLDSWLSCGAPGRPACEGT